MSYFQAIFLAVVQGLTEFLPVSSSGHLVIFQKIFRLQPPILFDVLLHLATLIAVVIFLRKDLKKITLGLIKRQPNQINLLVKIIIGTLPAIIFGLVINKYLGKIFDSSKIVGIALGLTAILLFSTRYLKKTGKQLGQIKSLDALIIGSFQALAIIPGVSRSGATIVSGLWRGFKQEAAFYFSLYLSIPAILGATALRFPDLLRGEFGYLNQAILGMIIAIITGYFSLRVVERVLRRGKLWVFGLYCILIGLFLLLA